MTGSHEVRGSIPLGSTNHFNDLEPGAKGITSPAGLSSIEDARKAGLFKRNVRRLLGGFK